MDSFNADPTALPALIERPRYEALDGVALAKTATLAACVLACLQWAAPMVGLGWTTHLSLILLAGVVLTELLPASPFAVGTAVYAVALVQTAKLPLVLYAFAMVALTFALRKRPWAFVLVLVGGIIVVPKELFRCCYHSPELYDWIQPILLGQIFYVSVLWWKEQREGRPQIESFAAWVSLFFFPAFAATPVAFAPSVLWQTRRRAWREVAQSLALVLGKAAAVLLLGRLGSDLRFSSLSRERLLGMPFLDLWFALAVHYLRYTLVLSGSFDVVVTLARLFGWPLPNAFRFALLAWNPVELWRRWSVYSRKLLLKLVYFPLGGGARHRLRNVMLTFVASGFVLHSGWIGSQYWDVHLPGLRDWTVYFLLQGLWVCSCLAWWKMRGKDPSSDRHLRLSFGRATTTLLTQAATAWLHILVFAPHLAWLDRWRLMLHCLHVKI